LRAGTALAILVNMFTDKPEGPQPEKRPRGRGRPSGPTTRGLAMRRRLYQVAIRLFAQRGFEATTMRDIAAKADVSAALLYRYFPGKDALVMELHDELSRDFERRAAPLPGGTWRVRFLFALRASLTALGPHRETLVALIPMLVSRRAEGIFSRATDFARERVQGAFEAAVTGASDAPRANEARALGRLLYLGHLGVLLWWLLDRSTGQRATEGLLVVLERACGPIAFALKVPATRRLLVELDAAAGEALFGGEATPSAEGAP